MFKRVYILLFLVTAFGGWYNKSRKPQLWGCVFRSGCVSHIKSPYGHVNKVKMCSERVGEATVTFGPVNTARAKLLSHNRVILASATGECHRICYNIDASQPCPYQPIQVYEMLLRISSMIMRTRHPPLMLTNDSLPLQRWSGSGLFNTAAICFKKNKQTNKWNTEFRAAQMFSEIWKRTYVYIHTSNSVCWGPFFLFPITIISIIIYTNTAMKFKILALQQTKEQSVQRESESICCVLDQM